MKIKAFLRRHVRTIPWVIIGLCIFLMLTLSYLTLGKIEAQQAPLVETVRKQEELIAQNKELSKQNGILLDRTIFLANRNIYYSKCIAGLFSEYTQTGRPIVVTKISKCETKSNGVSSTVVPTAATTPVAQESSSEPELGSNPEPEPDEMHEVCDTRQILFLTFRYNCREEPV